MNKQRLVQVETARELQNWFDECIESNVIEEKTLYDACSTPNIPGLNDLTFFVKSSYLTDSSADFKISLEGAYIDKLLKRHTIFKLDNVYDLNFDPIAKTLTISGETTIILPL